MQLQSSSTHEINLNEPRGELPSSYYETGDRSNSRLLKPFVVQTIRKFWQPGQLLLDYGCGNGDLAAILAKDYSLHCVDQSQTAVGYALRTLAGHPRVSVNKVSSNRVDLPDRSVNGIICNLVLMMVGERSSLVSIFQEFSRCLQNSGQAIVTVTHPGFRHIRFPSFYNLLPDGFKYSGSGTPYGVRITQEHEPLVEFTDYHWTIEDYTSIACNAGFRIHNIYEPLRIVKVSSPWDSLWNRKVKYPPFLVFIFEKIHRTC